MSQVPPYTDGSGNLNYASPPPKPAIGMAVAALVCGLLGMLTCLFPLGLVGVILAIVALVRSSREPTRYGGTPMAIGGLVTGGISVLIAPLVLAIIIPSVAEGREAAMRTRSMTNMRGIAQACLIYANDNDGAFPPDLQVLLNEGLCGPENFVNPLSGNSPPACDYFYVTGLTEDDAPNWIVAYSDPAHHDDEGASILYLDGHVNFVKEPGFSQEIQAFEQAYEADRGEPPVVIPPQ